MAIGSELESPSGTSEQAMGIQGRWVNLRPVLPDDTRLLFGWRADASTLQMLHGNRRMPPFDEFRAELENILRTTNTLIAEDSASRRAIGYVQGYNANMADGWVLFLAYFSSPYQNKPHGAEATLLFLNYLFDHFPFRKVYAEVFEYNPQVCKMLERGGFKEEGRAKEHTFFQDRFWDLINYALWREDWYQLRNRFRFLLDVENDARELLVDKARTGLLKGNGDGHSQR